MQESWNILYMGKVSKQKKRLLNSRKKKNIAHRKNDPKHIIILDLHKMLGKRSKNILPNGGEEWLFTTVQSKTSQTKQIQPKLLNGCVS